MKILFLAANPQGTSKLQLDEEVNKIDDGLQRSKLRDQFQLVSKWAVDSETLRRALLSEQPDIVHFSGHGEGQAGLVLVGQDGKPKPATTDALAGLFKIFSRVKCVLLNACYAEEQAKAIVQHIDHVIGMQRAVRDDAAIAFATGFYDGLGYGLSIENAFELGRNAIQFELASFSSVTRKLTHTDLTETEAIIEPLSEHLVPVLLRREGRLLEGSDSFVAPPLAQVGSITENLPTIEETNKADALQQYRERVKEFLADRELTPVKEFQLATCANVLRLTEEETDRILEEALNCIQKAKEDYEQTLIKTIQRGFYPFDQTIQDQLRDLAVHLELTATEAETISSATTEAHINKLQQYEQAFIKELRAMPSPLDDLARARLKQVQQSLELSDKYVNQIEQNPKGYVDKNKSLLNRFNLGAFNDIVQDRLKEVYGSVESASNAFLPRFGAVQQPLGFVNSVQMPVQQTMQIQQAAGIQVAENLLEQVVVEQQNQSKPSLELNSVEIEDKELVVEPLSLDSQSINWKCVHTLSQHIEDVRSVGIHLGMKRIVSGGDDKTIKVWDSETGQLLQNLKGHGGWVTTTCFSPDAQILISGSADKTLRLWDFKSGKLVRILKGHSDWITNTSISKDGQFLVSSSTDQTIKLWNPKTGQVLHTFKGHKGFVRSTAISPDSLLLVSGSNDKTIKLWNLVARQLLKTLEGHSGFVVAVAISSDGEHLVSGSEDQTIKVWNLPTGELKATLTGHIGAVTSVAITEDGKWLVSAGEDRNVKIWDLSTGGLCSSLEAHSARISSVAVSHNGQLLVTGSNDTTVKLWKL